MRPSSLGTDERSRKNHSVILRRLASIGQASLAVALGVSEATISRWKSEQAEQCAKALAVLGLKVVPIEYECYKAETVDWLLQGVKLGVGAVRSRQDLVDEDSE